MENQLELGSLTTWGVKIPQETKDKLKKILEENNMQGKDFIDTLLALYESNIIKQNSPLISQDLDELETLVRRIINIFNNSINRVDTILKDKDDKYAGIINGKEESINITKEKLKEVQEQLNSLKFEKDELLSSFSRLEKDNEDLKATHLNETQTLSELTQTQRESLERLKKENERLERDILEYRKLKDVNVELKERENILIKNNDALVAQNKELETNLFDLQKQTNVLETKITENASKAEERKEIEKEKMRIEITDKYEKKIEKIRNENNDKITELLDREKWYLDKFKEKDEKQK